MSDLSQVKKGTTWKLPVEARAPSPACAPAQGSCCLPATPARLGLSVLKAPTLGFPGQELRREPPPQKKDGVFLSGIFGPFSGGGGCSLDGRLCSAQRGFLLDTTAPQTRCHGGAGPPAEGKEPGGARRGESGTASRSGACSPAWGPGFGEVPGFREAPGFPGNSPGIRQAPVPPGGSRWVRELWS